MVIDAGLSASMARLEAYFRADERCVAMYLWGSLGAGTADAFSDVDVAIVVEDAQFEAVKAELRGLCETLCGPVLVWLPEGERPGSCNFAFLFSDGGKTLLYDCFLSSLARASEGPGGAPKRVLFDRAGLFPETAQTRPTATTSISPGLPGDIDNYWVYMYLNGKYFCRRDVHKMLYVQSVLFNTHLKVLLEARGEPKATWWARDVHALPDQLQTALLCYFPAPDPGAVAAALWQEMDLFTSHARAACHKATVDYPGALEAAVRKHLRDMGLG